MVSVLNSFVPTWGDSGKQGLGTRHLRHVRGLQPSQGPQYMNRDSVGVELKFHGVGQVRGNCMKCSGRIMKKGLRNCSACSRARVPMIPVTAFGALLPEAQLSPPVVHRLWCGGY